MKSGTFKRKAALTEDSLIVDDDEPASEAAPVSEEARDAVTGQNRRA